MFGWLCIAVITVLSSADGARFSSKTAWVTIGFRYVGGFLFRVDDLVACCSCLALFLLDAEDPISDLEPLSERSIWLSRTFDKVLGSAPPRCAVPSESIEGFMLIDSD